MPTFPDIRQSPRRNKVIPNSGRIFERDRNGDVWLRSPYPADKFEIQKLFPRITKAERDTIIAFWNANKNVRIDFTDKSDGQTYNCYMKEHPISDYVQEDQWDVSVDFIV